MVSRLGINRLFTDSKANNLYSFTPCYDDHERLSCSISANVIPLILASMELDAWHYDNHVATAPILIAFNASNTIPALLSPTAPGLDVGSHWGCRF